MGKVSSKFVQLSNSNLDLLGTNFGIAHRRGISSHLRKILSPQQSQQDSLEIDISNVKNTLNLQWLRHHCRCGDCFDSSTLQRKLIPAHLPRNPQIESFDFSNNSADFNVKWADGHKSTFNVNWLLETHPKRTNSPGESSSSRYVNFNFIRESIEKHKDFWDQSMEKKEKIPNEICFEDFYMGSESVSRDAIRNLISNVQTFGYSILRDVPSTPEMLKSVVSKIARPMSTFFSPDICVASSDLAFKDSAYTSDRIYLHTDMTYYNEPAGIEMFLCLKYDGTGGQSFLADGFKVSAQLYEENPKFYEILSTVPIPSQFLDPKENYNYEKSDLTISHNVLDGRIEKFRFNPHDMADLKNLKFEEISLFYKSLIRVSELIEENPLVLELRPGKLLFFDNWRILHGRNEYKGTRILASAYINRSDWLSKARTLNVI